MTANITDHLPKVISDYIAACNAHDIEAWMATFAPDALLNDISREFIGAEAIRSFAAKEIFGDNVTMTVHRAWDRYGNATVHTKFDGTSDKTNLPDPLILTQYFTMQGRLTTQLIILRNKTPV